MTVDEIIDREIAAGVPFGPVHRHWLKLRREHRPFSAPLPPGFRRMPEQTFTGITVGHAPTAAFTARNTFTAETNIIGDSAASATPQAMINQFCAIPANDARAGRVYKLEAGGIYSNTGTPTMSVTPRWGSSTTVATNITLGASGTFTTITATTNLPWYMLFTFVIRTAPPGATLGTGYGTGRVDLGIPVTSSQFTTGLYMGGTAATIDTSGLGTAGCGLTFNWIWSASSASNTLTTQWFLLRSLN